MDAVFRADKQVETGCTMHGKLFSGSFAYGATSPNFGNPLVALAVPVSSPKVVLNWN